MFNRVSDSVPINTYTCDQNIENLKINVSYTSKISDAMFSVTTALLIIFTYKTCSIISAIIL